MTKVETQFQLDVMCRAKAIASTICNSQDRNNTNFAKLIGTDEEQINKWFNCTDKLKFSDFMNFYEKLNIDSGFLLLGITDFLDKAVGDKEALQNMIYDFKSMYEPKN